VENVSDRAYVSNSFHCHVTEDITPIEKQDLENRFWDLCNGGKIQYVKYPINYNKEAIKSLVRVSKPGLRRYTNVEEMPRVLNGLGIAILSTSMGLMTDKEARQRNVGGEVLCYVY
jgi:ribosomal protein S8